VIRKGSWPVLPVFRYLQEKGNLPDATAYRTFNMGIGMVVIVPRAQAVLALRSLCTRHEQAYVIGKIEKGKTEVRLK